VLGPGELEPIGQHDQLAFKLTSVVQYDEHDPAVLGEHRRVDHARTVGVGGDTDHGPSAAVC
jgi:hypothetical protein